MQYIWMHIYRFSIFKKLLSIMFLFIPYIDSYSMDTEAEFLLFKKI